MEIDARRLFFSIVIPAHNEAAYIGATLEHLAALSYPSDRFEVIVIENGSSDATLDVARRYEGGNIRVYQSAPIGVSAAKNFGIDRLAAHSDWVVFLDADTILKPDFLSNLGAALQASRKPLAVGTTKVLPLDRSRNARAWFAYYNLAHRIGKGSFAIQIARRALFPGLRFDEQLTMGEDLKLIKQARTAGGFFFVSTRTVYTSTRRFDTVGYWRLFFQWTLVSLLPTRRQTEFGYKIVR